ncbi:MAG TPA: thiamine biosynthesis protein ThiF [Sulfurimonas sp.]
MIDGFDLSDPLVCEGIVGDGCGGGRIFFIENETLYAHDPLSKDNRELLKNIKKAKNISKSGCIITIECQEQKIEFDLSKVKAR